MISALLYLQYHSFRNQLAVRLKRLRQPKYLAGAIVGGLYFYFYVIQYAFRARGPHAAAGIPGDPALFETIGASVFFLFILSAWIFPRERAALAFTEAEVAFLFPAPISRRGLIHFKLLRSQTAILFTSLFLMLIFRRFGGTAWIRAAGWWVILSMLNLHVLGASFARTMLLDRGISNAWRRIIVLLLAGLLIGGAVFWASRTIPRADVATLDSFEKLKAYVEQVFASGPLPWLLYPFRLVVRPYLARDVASFFTAIGPALCLLMIHYGWVLRSNVSFEEASIEASKRLAEKVAAIRSGNWRNAGKKVKARRSPFPLSPLGPAPVALLWKNLISTGQMFTARIWIFLAIFLVAAGVEMHQRSADSAVLPSIGMIAVMFLGWTVILGPQAARQDFRQDLMHADALKLYPLPGWQIAVGELLAPAVILTSIQWLLLIVIVAFFPGARNFGGWPVVLGCGFGAAIVLPMLNLISLLIPNAAVLLFPAWFQIGKGGGQGIEATGQRLIFMLGQLLVFLIALIPAAIAFSAAFFPLHLFLHETVIAIPAGALCAAIALGIEAALGFKLLGSLFERLDWSAETAA